MFRSRGTQVFGSRGLPWRVVIVFGIPAVALAVVNRLGWLEGAGGAITAFAIVAWIGAFLLFRRDQKTGKKRRRPRKRHRNLNN